MAQYTSLSQYIQQAREQTEQVKQQERNRLAQQVEMEGKLWQQEASFQQAAEHIKAYGTQMLGAFNPYSSLTSKDIRTNGADYYIQEIDFAKQRRAAELSGVETTTPDQEGKPAEQRPIVEIQADTIAKQEVDDWKWDMSDKYSSLGKKYPDITQKIMSDVETAPVDKKDEVLRTSNEKMANLDEFDKNADGIRDLALSNGIDFDTEKYKAELSNTDVNYSEVTRRMKDDWLVQSFEVTREQAMIKANAEGNKALNTLLGDPNKVLIMKTMADNPDYAAYFDETGILKPEYAGDNEIVGTITRLTSEFENQEKGLNKEVTTLNQQIKESITFNQTIADELSAIDEKLTDLFMSLLDGNASLNKDNRTMIGMDGKPVRLSSKEFRILSNAVDKAMPVTQKKAELNQLMSQQINTAREVQIGKQDTLFNISNDVGGVGMPRTAQSYLDAPNIGNAATINLENIQVGK